MTVYYLDSINWQTNEVRVAQTLAGLPCDWTPAGAFAYPHGKYPYAPVIASPGHAAAMGIPPFFWPGYVGAGTPVGRCCGRKYEGDPHVRGCWQFREPATIPAPALAPPPPGPCPCGIDRRDCEYHRCP